MQRYKKNPKQRRFPEIYLLSPVFLPNKFYDNVDDMFNDILNEE